MREKYCWLIAGGLFVLRENYCCLVVDKPNEQGVSVGAATNHAGTPASNRGRPGHIISS
jgi:hypothetical protein